MFALAAAVRRCSTVAVSVWMRFEYFPYYHPKRPVLFTQRHSVTWEKTWTFGNTNLTSSNLRVYY